MNNFTEQDRIEQFKKTMKHCMPDRFPEGFIDTLKEKGFFTAPASIHHHGAYSGALFDHSLAVANSLLSLTKRLELKWQDGRSPLIVGMFHDLCKVDNYTRTDNEAWEYNNATLLPGHGDKSVIMLQQYMRLTEEEMLPLGIKNDDIQVDFAEGDMVVVTAGAWKDTAGVITAISTQKQTVTINVELFGRETPVEISFADIKKA